MVYSVELLQITGQISLDACLRELHGLVCRTDSSVERALAIKAESFGFKSWSRHIFSQLEKLALVTKKCCSPKLIVFR